MALQIISLTKLEFLRYLFHLFNDAGHNKTFTFTLKWQLMNDLLQKSIFDIIFLPHCAKIRIFVQELQMASVTSNGLKLVKLNFWTKNKLLEQCDAYLAWIGLWCNFWSPIEKCHPKSQLPKVLKNVHDSFPCPVEGLSSEATLDWPASCPFLWCNSSWCWTFASTAFNCLGLNSKVSRAW